MAIPCLFKRKVCASTKIGQASHGRNEVHRYYGHKLVVGETINCKTKRLRADEVETITIAHLTEILFRGGHFDHVETNLRKSIGAEGSDLVAERDRVQREIVGVESEIDGAMKLMDQVSKNPDVINLVHEKLEKLAAKKKLLITDREALVLKIEEINDAKAGRSVIETNAQEFKKGWSKACQAMKRRLLRRLVDSLIYTREGLYAYYVTAKEQITVQPISSKKMASEENSEAMSNNIYSIKKNPRYPSRISADGGVPRVGIGGGYPSKVEPNRALCVSMVRGASWARNTLDLAELARLRQIDGLTTAEIAARLGYGRSTVVKAIGKLRSSGMAATKA